MHAGSRPPVVLPAGSGAVAGLSLATRPSELVAATYEGVALELLRSLRLLDTSFASTLSVVLGGGAVAASPWWRRAFAATFDRDVRYQVNPEVGARGAAMLALGVAPVPPDTRLPTVPDEVAAMRVAGARYDDVRARFVRCPETHTPEGWLDGVPRARTGQPATAGTSSGRCGTGFSACRVAERPL